MPFHAAAGSPPPPGPTIFDPSLGYVRFSGKTIAVYKAGGPVPPVDYTPDEFASFSRVFERIRLRIAAVAGVPGLMFTAPLFVTRLVGDETWEPNELHDAYFHAHVDGRSTPHYHYSGLLCERALAVAAAPAPPHSSHAPLAPPSPGHGRPEHCGRRL